MRVLTPTTAFSAAQYHEAYPPGVEGSFWHVARNAIIASQLEESGMNQMPLLEIGCGRGIVVDYLRHRGLDCIGCDLAAPSIAEHLAGSVFPSTDFRALAPERSARIEGVLLCDVLEHMPVEGELLRDVLRGLPGVTHVLITVPARKELWSGWDEHFGHFRRYDLEALGAEIRSAGLELLSARYFFHSLYVPMYLARGRRRDTTIARPTAPALHRLLGKAFIVEGRVVPSRVPGTSIIATARVSV